MGVHPVFSARSFVVPNHLVQRGPPERVRYRDSASVPSSQSRSYLSGDAAPREARHRASPRGVVRARGEHERRPRALRDRFQGDDLRPQGFGCGARVWRVGGNRHDPWGGHGAKQRREEFQAGRIHQHDHRDGGCTVSRAKVLRPRDQGVPRVHRGVPQVLHTQSRPFLSGVVGEEGVPEPTRVRPAPRVHAVDGVNRREVRHIARRDVSGVAAARLPVRAVPRSCRSLLVFFRFVPANKTRRSLIAHT